jgi:hypothetical protein
MKKAIRYIIRVAWVAYPSGYNVSAEKHVDGVLEKSERHSGRGVCDVDAVIASFADTPYKESGSSKTPSMAVNGFDTYYYDGK